MCISELAVDFRPQVLAFSLLGLELEHYLCLSGNDSMRQRSLRDTFEMLKNLVKLDDESIERCQHKIIDELRMYGKMTTSSRCHLRSHGLGYSSLHHSSCEPLDVIEEVDEDQYDQDQHDTHDDYETINSQTRSCHETDDEDNSSHSDTDNHLSTSSSSSSLAQSTSTTPSSFLPGLCTYADVLAGRQCELKKPRNGEYHFMVSLNSECNHVISSNDLFNSRRNPGH